MMSTLKSNLPTIFLTSVLGLTSCVFWIHESKMCDAEENKNIKQVQDNLAEFNGRTGMDYQIVGGNGQYTAIIPFTPLPLHGVGAPFIYTEEMIKRDLRALGNLQASYTDMQDNKGCAMGGSASIERAFIDILNDYSMGAEYSRRPVLEQI